MAEMLAKSQMVPKSYQAKPQDTLVAMMMGSELGLNPIQALQNIAVINGKPSIYGDALIALVQAHPAFGGIQETFDEQSMTATCHVRRKRGEWHAQTFSKADAEKAGLWGKPGPWQQYPKRMLQMRARGFALRDTFADALAGLITAEEAEDMPADDRPSPPRGESRPTYPDDEFRANFATWQGYVEAGKTTVERLINKIQTKGELSDDQISQLRALENINQSEEASS
ncbi:MAG: hypothetical protein ACOC00_05660 [Halothiobacillaceae bacterium]